MKEIAVVVMGFVVAGVLAFAAFEFWLALKDLGE